MKELSIKEKAKRYDEALEIAKEYFKANQKIGELDENDTLLGIFPELKGSEDEQIRKWIIDDIKYNMNNESLNNSEYIKKAEKAIAWLEKQGEQNPCGQMEKCAKCQFVFTGYCNGTCILKNKEPTKEGKDERISWLNSLEDRFSNQESNKDHWQDVRERTAIAAIQAFCSAPVNKVTETMTIDDATKFAIEIADALVEKLKGK